MTVNGGLRRQIHVELSKEKITALDLSVDRVVSTIRSENQNIPLGEVDEGDTTYLLRSQGQFQNLDEIRDLVVQTEERRAGVPARHRGRHGHDRGLPLVPRINGKPGVRMQVDQAVGQEHRGDRDGRAGGDRADEPRSAVDPPDAPRRPVRSTSSGRSPRCARPPTSARCSSSASSSSSCATCGRRSSSARRSRSPSSARSRCSTSPASR